MKLPGSGHVGGQEQKQFSSLGTKLRFHKKFCKKNVIVMTTIMAVMSDGWKPRIMQPFNVWVVRKLLPGFPRSLVDEYWQADLGWVE